MNDEKADQFFKETDRFNKKKISEAQFVFRALIWKAIDEKDKSFSIVETAKMLGLHK